MSRTRRRKRFLPARTVPAGPAASAPLPGAVGGQTRVEDADPRAPFGVIPSARDRGSYVDPPFARPGAPAEACGERETQPPVAALLPRKPRPLRGLRTGGIPDGARRPDPRV